MAETRRTFTREYKLSAVKLVSERGRSFSEAARSLGIASELLRRWKAAFEAEGAEAFPGLGFGGPLGPREPVRQRALPGPAGGPGDRVQHEPPRQLLGQRAHGEFLRKPEKRADKDLLSTHAFSRWYHLLR